MPGQQLSLEELFRDRRPFPGRGREYVRHILGAEARAHLRARRRGFADTRPVSRAPESRKCTSIRCWRGPRRGCLAGS
jgi:hypothetical protein